jgi:hypothetical protein
MHDGGKSQHPAQRPWMQISPAPQTFVPHGTGAMSATSVTSSVASLGLVLSVLSAAASAGFTDAAHEETASATSAVAR